MSTSPDAPQGENFTGRPADADRRPLWDSRRPEVVLLKGIFWLALVVGALAALAMNYEIVWDVWVGTVIPGLETLLEVAEKLLDSFYLLVGAGAFAPMATAYTGFVLFLGVFYLAARKAMAAYQKTRTKKQELARLYAGAWNEWYGTVTTTAKERWTAWWDSLGFTDKLVAVTFMVLIGIPIALLLSFVLGSLVANLF
jgi:hypothetical protein